VAEDKRERLISACRFHAECHVEAARFFLGHLHRTRRNLCRPGSWRECVVRRQEAAVPVDEVQLMDGS
jgi:hypothetical protein